MTSTQVRFGALVRPGRALAATALATLAALAVTGCGADSGGSGSPGEPGASAGSGVSAGASSPEQVAFAAMLEKFAEPCPSSDRSADRAASGPTDEKSIGPERKQSLAPGETPPTEPVEPGAPTGPGAALNDRDWCASARHEQRVIAALQQVAEPTPAKVRTTLKGLGYIDERIHGVEQDGRTTRFYLDLRESGGQLCEAGLAAGEQTEVTVAPVEGTPCGSGEH